MENSRKLSFNYHLPYLFYCQPTCGHSASISAAAILTIFTPSSLLDMEHARLATSTSLLAWSANTAAYSSTPLSSPAFAASIRTNRGTLVSRKESDTWSTTAFLSCKLQKQNRYLSDLSELALSAVCKHSQPNGMFRNNEKPFIKQISLHNLILVCFQSLLNFFVESKMTKLAEN